MPEKHPAAVALGKLNKGKTSERKAVSSRENGKKGGAPRHPDRCAKHPRYGARRPPRAACAECRLIYYEAMRLR